MALRFLLDENLRGLLWRYIVRHNARGVDPIDVIRVGDAGVFALGATDPDILDWCETNGRILVSHDKRTIPAHLLEHLTRGRHCNGVFLVRDAHPADIVEFLVAAAHASEPDEWHDRYIYIP